MSAFIQQASLLSGRQATLAVTIGLHALVISVLMAVRVAPDVVPPVPRLQLVPVTPEPPTQYEVPDRIERAEMVAPRPIELIVPAESIDFPEHDAAPLAGPSLPDVAGLQPGDDAAGEGAVSRDPVLAGLTWRAVRSPDEFYPPASVTLQEEGFAIVRVCVGANGRIEGRPVVETTSGSRRLDAAAVEWARQALQFSPATRDGVPVSACKGFRVNFSLR